MIKAIIFDCFGVLTTEGFRAFCTKYFVNQPEKRAEAQELMDQANLAQMSHEAFVEKLSKLSGKTTAEVHDYLDSNQPNEQLFNYIRQRLKPKYKIGMLSNASSNWLDELFAPEDISLFDDIILSYEVGITKPDPGIYKLSAKKLGVEMKESVLVDDVDRYCEGARAVGMQAILYRDFDQMKTELEKIL